MIKLNCPTCGGELELPDNLGIAHCMYCGAKILINTNEGTQEKQNLKRYIELCRVAFEGKNYEETIQYCNKILEIDLGNVEAWIDKSIATFWLTTATNNRYDEAMGYLKKAEELASGDDRINRARDQLKINQGNWYLYLGNNEETTGDNIWQTYMSGSVVDIEDFLTIEPKARANSIKYFITAMNHFLSAESYIPNDIAILQSIESLATTKNWINWSDIVRRKIQILQVIRAKPDAEQRLPSLKQELKLAEQNLAKLMKGEGLFDIFKTQGAKDKVKNLKDEIARYEKIITYEISS